jgi:Tol biopolymer transport system component
VGTENVNLPFWSYDSRSIGFFADGKLKRVSVADGRVEVICDAPDGRGGTWNRDNVIVFAPIATGPLSRVSAGGGQALEIMAPDTAKHETALRFPMFLPDGRHYLFAGLPAKKGAYDIFVGTLGSPERKLLLTAGSLPAYAEPGILVFNRGERLWAQRFDAGALKMVGDAVPAGPAPPLIGASGAPVVSISRTGILARSSATPPIVRFTWLDRSGREIGPFPLPLGSYGAFQFSRDGKRAAIEKLNGPNTSDLWILDIERALASRLTSLPASSVLNETWSPDGKWIAFSCDVEGPYDIYRKSAGGEGSEELLYHSDVPLKNISQWSPDGRFILFDQPDPTTGWDIWMLPVEGDRKPVPLVRGRFNETAGRISPDGRWLCFASDESGKTEVYVQSYPTPGNKMQASTNGAFFGGWSADGKELAMATPDGGVTLADVQSSTTFRIGQAHSLFRPRPDLIGFAPTPDLKRFLMSTVVGPTTTLTTVCEINWAEGLFKR